MEKKGCEIMVVAYNVMTTRREGRIDHIHEELKKNRHNCNAKNKGKQQEARGEQLLD